MKNFVILCIVLLLLWGSIFFIIARYGEVLREHPCVVCAKKVGYDITCTTIGKVRTFFPNGSWEDVETAIIINRSFPDINLSLLDEIKND